jgi:hypothetical protein
MKFTTIETHLGDRPHEPYTPGETREVDDESSVKHLVDLGVLGKHDAKAEAAWEKAKKAEGNATENKAEGGADENKAA